MRLGLLAVSISAALLPSGAARAWGASGHEWISGIAADAFPDELPSFLRTPEAAADIAVLGRESDRSKGAGRTHDAERDPGHYVDLADDGTVFGAVTLPSLPATREEYDTLLRGKGQTQYTAGYLPYAILDGWQQLRKEVAYRRAAGIGADTAKDTAERIWFQTDQRLRERLIIRDLGVWSHYVGDGSQPMHVSIHFNGWGNAENPAGFTQSRDIHARFEGAYVHDNVSRATVAGLIGAYHSCSCTIKQRIAAYLGATRAQIVPLYEHEKAGNFAGPTQAGISFVNAQLAAGAAEFRDLVVDAWRDSPDVDVGYPPVRLADIQAGKRAITRATFGAD
jgi:hypothetical protein